MTTATATVNVVPPPAVTISANPVTIKSGETATLSWTATNATSCTINPGIGSVPPSGTRAVSPAATATYTLTATGEGGTTTASVTVTVNIVSRINLTITSPVNGASLTGSSVMVRGTVSNTLGYETGVTVNGMYIASLSDGQFAVNNVPLLPGANTINVTAVDTSGTAATSSVAVTAAQEENYVHLRTFPDSGIAPLETTMRVSGSFTVADPVITPQGPGAVEQLPGFGPDEYRYSMTTPGIYYFTAQVTNPDGVVYQDTVAVTVLSAQLDTLLRAKWEEMKTALNNGDISGAVRNFAPETQSDYQQLFTSLTPVLASAVGELYTTHINLISAANNRAIYEIIVTREGRTLSFQLQFVQDGNGIWKIWKY